MIKRRRRVARIGVYVCHCGMNIAAVVDVDEVVRYASSLPNVVVARAYRYMCSDPGQALIMNDIREFDLSGVVVASCSPRMHEPTFRKCCTRAGLNEYCFEQANIREHCSWVHEDVSASTDKAKSLVRAAVERVARLEPLSTRKVSVVPRALVIGGGVSGIYAALELADKGIETILVERSPSIGGHMAQLDKTFPTLDCSACILTPKMVEVSRHENITLITYAEVESVEGFVGNFKVRIRKKPRYVDEMKCTGCGLCAEACRLRDKIPNEFDIGMSKRSAIYIPFAQAVPSVYVIDEENCLMISKGKCGKKPPCVDACNANAIDFHQKEEFHEINVGAIIVATGFDVYEPEYDHEGVITALEFERISNASGPTGGKIEINGRVPRKVVIISCVGSRSEERKYCSRICCMYIAKHAHLIKEKIPDADVTVLYTDVRAFGKGFEEFYQRVLQEGVKYVRRELGEHIEIKEEGDNICVYASCEGEMRKFDADMVILATALIPSDRADEMARLLKISRGPDGFFLEAHPKLRPVDTLSEGIFIAGCCQSPKDISDTVAQAVGAAVRASALILRGEVEIEPVVAFIEEGVCVGCGMCAAICPFGAVSVESKKAVVNDVLCKGCGSCASACPSGAISVMHYKDDQMIAQVDALSID